MNKRRTNVVPDSYKLIRRTIMLRFFHQQKLRLENRLSCVQDKSLVFNNLHE